MPRLSVWFVRTALTYLGLGFTLGAIMLAHRGTPLLSPGVQLLPAHIEFLLVGWMVQLALGVGFWVLPRFRTGRERGREELAWLSYVLLNLGVLGSTVGFLVPLPAIMPLLGHLAQGLATVCFALHAWPRIKAFGT